MIHYRNFDECLSFKALAGLPTIEVSRILTPERIDACAVNLPEGFIFSYAAAPVDEAIVVAMQELADEQQLIEKYKALIDGEVMNTGEKRMVLHHLARGQLGTPVISNGQNLRAFYEGERAKIAEFTEAVHRGKILGSTGKPFTTAVQI
ncbi:MAG: glucose-6-phosphate isomerase, partial [Rectinemataceae bacterium]